MDHALPMGVVQGRGNFAGDSHRIIDRQLPLPFQPGAQRLARHQRHDVIQQRIRLAAVEQWEDVGVLEPRSCPDLRKKAVAAQRGTQVGVQHLDGDIAFVADVVREVDRGHAALTEFALDAVAIGQRGGEACESLSHRALVAEATARL